MNQLYNMWNQEYIQNLAVRQHHNQQMIGAEMCATIIEHTPLFGAAG
jgi:hypothetical protein